MFKWVVIVGARRSVIALTLLTRPLVGALWGLVLVIAGCGLCAIAGCADSGAKSTELTSVDKRCISR